MKFTTLALTLLIATAVLADDKVTIDLYYESLCPGKVYKLFLSN